MRELFKGWRRKTGCITLVMALAMMGMWMRSLVTLDSISIARKGNSIEELQSADGNISWISWDNSDDIGPQFDWGTWPLDSGGWISPDAPIIRWRFRWLGLGLGFGSGGNTIRFVSYWFVTIPLTLLSAYLILWPGKQVGFVAAKNPD